MLAIREGRSRRRPSTRLVIAVSVTLAMVAAGTAVAANAFKHAGPSGDGTAITPVGFRVDPAGQQTTLGSLPLASATAPDGRTMLIVNAGDANQSVQVVDTATSKVVQTLTYQSPQAVFTGVAYSPDGTHAYVSGGGNNVIRAYGVTGGHLTEATPMALPTKNPSGAAVNMYPAGLAVTPEGRRLVVADQLADAASVVDIATGTTQTVAVGHDPYGVVLSQDGRTAYVTNQGGNTVSVLDISAAAPVLTSAITVGTHPNQVVRSADGRHLFVANGDSDGISDIDTASGRVTDTISLTPYRGAPVGANPDGLALASDGRSLYVSNSGDNDVAVVDVDHGRVAGLIPTAWYPTGVQRVGNSLLILNAKGLGAGPNPNGPNPYTDDQRRVTDPAGFAAQYVGTMMMGTLSTVGVPGRAQLAHYTAQVNANDGFAQGDSVRGAGGAGEAIVPMHVGQPSPIKHVIYVVKENRTYDQEFGSLGKGNGDPTLDLFGDESAPNSRALESRFVTLDNFYADAEVSAQGWNWSVGANSNPYVEQTWVANYSGRNHPYDYEGGNFATAMNANPHDSYIWDRLADAGVSFRNFGFYETDNHLNTGPSGADPRLAANTDPNYYGWDLRCPDSSGTLTPKMTCTPRVDYWLTQFNQYVRNNDMPAVQFVRIGNDHTEGTAAGYPTPRAYVADNDYALGRLVDAVSHSKYWKSTAIFVVEDDAQAGPDHVDSHRSVGLAISAYNRPGALIHKFHSTVS